MKKQNKKHELSPSAFLKRVKDTITQYDMLHKGDRVLVGVSGGPDSVCLLKVLLELSRKIGIEVVAGNVDHSMRGKESAAESKFVENLSGRLGVKYVHKKINVMSGKKSISPEERAREGRYAFFKRAAIKNNCNVIATGHTMSDQAETVLMRILHGSSLAGITGIPPIRTEEDLTIIRPLIRIKKRSILDFLKSEKLKYVTDSSNAQVKFSRNKIRHEVLPFLEKYNPSIKRSLVNLSDALREDFIFLKSEKEKTVQKYASKRGTVKIKIKDIILQPKALRKELFKELFKKSGGNVKRLTYRHWMDMDCFLRTAAKNKSLDFPGDIRVTKNTDEIVFTKRN